jgi:hypothetical protein
MQEDNWIPGRLLLFRAKDLEGEIGSEESTAG